MKKRIGVLILMIFLGFILTACRGGKAPKAVNTTLDITRTTFTLVFEIEDKDNILNDKSLEGKLTYKETTLINTYTATKVKDDEGKEIDNKFQIIGTNLSINHEYTIKVTGVADKKLVTLINETFRTKHEGSSSDNPIFIYTIADFMKLDDDYNAYYKLVNDLDFSEVTDFTPVFLSRAFTGSFDGDGHTLKNISINKRHTYVAIFGRNSGTIKNLNIENMNINLTGTAQSSQYIGILAARNTGTIDNVTVKESTITTYFSLSGTVRIGGLVSYSESGSKINNSNVDVSFDITSISRTEYNIGGLAGQLNGASTSGNKVKTTINITNTTKAYIGGAVGLMDNSTLNLSSATESEAELFINIETKVDRVVANDKTVAISIGGFVGRAVEIRATDIYAKAKIVYPVIHNYATDQVSTDKVALGGFAGSILNRSEIENVLADVEISLGEVYDVIEPVEAKVKFELGYEKKRLDPILIKLGEPVAEPTEVPVREGYNFLGWYLGNELYDFNAPVNHPVNLVAQWEKIDPEAEIDKLVVLFDTDFSIEYYKTIEVIKGEVIEAPVDPIRNGHRFLGWYLDGELFDFDEVINYSTAIEARWERIAIDRIELIYIGGIAGESHSSTHIKNFARSPKITLYTEEGKYLVNPTVGYDYTLGSFSDSTILVNDMIYDNSNYSYDDEVVIIPMEETSLEDFFESEYIKEILNR